MVQSRIQDLTEFSGDAWLGIVDCPRDRGEGNPCISAKTCEMVPNCMAVRLFDHGLHIIRYI